MDCGASIGAAICLFSKFFKLLCRKSSTSFIRVAAPQIDFPCTFLFGASRKAEFGFVWSCGVATRREMASCDKGLPALLFSPYMSVMFF